MPSDVQGPDLPEEEPPAEPVELPELEPPPVGERVADGAGLVVEDADAVADVEAGAEAEAESESVAPEAGSVAELESSEDGLADGFGVVTITGLT